MDGPQRVSVDALKSVLRGLYFWQISVRENSVLSDSSCVPSLQSGATVRLSLELAKNDFTPKFCLSVYTVDTLYLHLLPLVVR